MRKIPLQLKAYRPRYILWGFSLIGLTLLNPKAFAKKHEPKTLLQNGLWASAYSMFILSQGVSESSPIAPTIKVGWLLSHGSLGYLGLGYGSVGLGAGSSYQGMDVTYWTAFDSSWQLGLAVLNGKGYKQRVTEASTEDARNTVAIDCQDILIAADWSWADRKSMFLGVSLRSFTFNEVDKEAEASDARESSLVFGARLTQF